MVLCEDTRVTGKLLRHHGVERALLAYHEHNAARMRPQIVARLQAGAVVALASDAGTPLISDPGYKLVRAAIEAGIEVFAVPGPSAALAALTVSGLPTDRFLVAGFLPERGARAARARSRSSARCAATLVLFEAARRLPATLAELAAALGPRAGRGRARADQALRGGAARQPRPAGRALCARRAAQGRGGAGDRRRPSGAVPARSRGELDAALADALATMSPAAAAATVAAATGRPRREVYRRALALKQAAGPEPARA